jgi:hypothetical protein
VRGLHDDGAHDQRRRIDERREQLATRAIDVAIVLCVIAFALGLRCVPRANLRAIACTVLPQDENLSNNQASRIAQPTRLT